MLNLLLRGRQLCLQGSQVFQVNNLRGIYRCILMLRILMLVWAKVQSSATSKRMRRKRSWRTLTRILQGSWPILRIQPRRHKLSPKECLIAAVLERTKHQSSRSFRTYKTPSVVRRRWQKPRYLPSKNWYKEEKGLQMRCRRNMINLRKTTRPQAHKVTWLHQIWPWWMQLERQNHQDKKISTQLLKRVAQVRRKSIWMKMILRRKSMMNWRRKLF